MGIAGGDGERRPGCMLLAPAAEVGEGEYAMLATGDRALSRGGSNPATPYT